MDPEVLFFQKVFRNSRICWRMSKLYCNVHSSYDDDRLLRTAIICNNKFVDLRNATFNFLLEKNNEKLQFRSIPHVSTDSDICIVQFQPDISSIVYYHLIRRHSKMVQARFMDCVGDIQRFDEHSSAFFVYMVLELNGGSIYVQCFVEIPTFSVSNNERKVEFLLIKKLNGGPWNVQRCVFKNTKL